MNILFYVFYVNIKEIKFCIWDLSGHSLTRTLWSNYYKTSAVDAVIWVVDSADVDSFKTVRTVIEKEMRDPSLEKVMLLVLANKQDQEGALDAEGISQRLKLSNFDGKRLWRCLPISALNGDGIDEVIKLLYTDMKSHLSGTNEKAGTSMPGPCCSCCAKTYVRE